MANLTLQTKDGMGWNTHDVDDAWNAYMLGRLLGWEGVYTWNQWNNIQTSYCLLWVLSGGVMCDGYMDITSIDDGTLCVRGGVTSRLHYPAAEC
jgi:hypothetical protein